MTVAITQKIVGFSVSSVAQGAAENSSGTGTEASTNRGAAQPVAAEPQDAAVPQDAAALMDVMGEHIDRPEVLSGSTYKIGKSPANDNALYVTINDIVLNSGTSFEQRRPFEIFINSKNMKEFQWIVAITRIMSAVFRKGGDVSFLVEEMKAIFDPNGGYWRPGGAFKNSLVAEIGEVIEQHLKSIGLIKATVLDPGMAALIEEKRRALNTAAGNRGTAGASAGNQAGGGENNSDTQFPPSATVCPKCSTRARVILDGCSTCLNCGDSKCG
jgi:hypothetical protein